jgi:hypothetical protein
MIHSFAPKLGIWLGNALGAFKLVLLSLVVFTGFAALNGNMVGEKPHNFSTFHGPGDVAAPSTGGNSAAAAAYALALLQVLYSYAGWENANYVSGHCVGPAGARHVLTIPA